MAKMLPPFVPEDYLSEGERAVFIRLRDDPGTEEWTVLHSLALANHRERVAGELDFVVIIPGMGILCLEVKGYPQVRCSAGVWYYGPGDKGSPRSPFRQASDGMYSLRRYVLQARSQLRDVQFTCGVIFPFALFNQASPEWHEWEFIDASRFQLPISQSLARMMVRSREHLLSSAKSPRLRFGAPTLPEVQDLSALLRPDFDVPLDPLGRRHALAGDLMRFTGEQFDALDAMSGNPRTIYAGPAGTGKTLLALEAARRAHLKGQRTLLLCFNRLLGSWLEQQTRQFRDHVEATTLHRYMLHAAGLDTAPPDASAHFWTTELPVLATRRVRESSDGIPPFDLLLIDEAQDLLRVSYLEFIDNLLQGGLADGTWRMFGDFEKAALYGTATIPLTEFREGIGSRVPLFNLRVNCRNTPLVAEWVHLLAQLQPKYTRIRRPDDGVQPVLRFYSTPQEQESMLDGTLESLLQSGFGEDEIVVLSSRAVGSCASHLARTARWHLRLNALGSGGPKAIRFGSVHSFKGLEAPAIVVTDIPTIGTPEASSIFYVAITRALQKLIILADQTVRDEAVHILTAAVDPSPI